jgi:hypothetical protein
MQLSVKFPRDRLDSLALIGGIIALADTVWGGLVALGLDWSRMNERLAIISFVLGLPLYLLDLCLPGRVALFLPALFFFRWIAICHGEPSLLLCGPWRVNFLLIPALLFLQLSKARLERKW